MERIAISFRGGSFLKLLGAFFGTFALNYLLVANAGDGDSILTDVSAGGLCLTVPSTILFLFWLLMKSLLVPERATSSGWLVASISISILVVGAWMLAFCVVSIITLGVGSVI